MSHRYLLAILLSLICLWNVTAYAKYDGFTPPGPVPIPVGVAFYINNVDYVSEATSAVELVVTIIAQWHDPHLKFEAIEGRTSKTYTGSAAQQMLENNWHPYLDILNREEVGETQQILLKINADGTAQLVHKMELNLDFNTDIQRFPFDKQTFSINLVPFAYTDEEVQLYKLPQYEGIASHIVVPSWHINPKFSSAIVQMHSKNLQGTHSVYQFTITLERHAHTYALQVLLPLLVIAFMCYLMILTPIDIGSIFQVLITIVLAMIAFQWLVLNIVPSTSYINFTEMLILISFLFCCFVMITLSFLEIIRKRHGVETREKALRKATVLLPLGYFLAIFVTILIFFIK